MEDAGHGGMDLAVAEVVADMTEVEAMEVLGAEVTAVMEEDIREGRKCF